MSSVKLADLYAGFLRSGGIGTDTRQDLKNKVFFALRGENFDGNRFAEKALEAGALMVVTDRKDLSGRDGIVWSPDPLQLLQDLSAHHRQRKGIEVMAVTGSNGKTTTKELMAAILGTRFRVLATRGNLNNHIGVPLTLLSLTTEEVAVVEMGANHPGEIARLSELADPGIGMITNVGMAHLEGFGSPEGVLKAKSELYGYLAGSGGRAIVDQTDKVLMKRALETGVEVLLAGPGGDLDVAGVVEENNPFLKIRLQIDGKVFRVATHMAGAYNLQNIILAAAAGIHFGIPPAEVAGAVEDYRPLNQRSQVLEGGRNRVILDAYNANPTSMREALKMLSGISDAPTMAILGEMAELGPSSAAEHASLAQWVEALDLDRVLMAGPTFFKACEPSVRSGVFRDRPALEKYLEVERPEGYTILVKGSRIMELEKLVPLLTQAGRDERTM